MIIMLSRFIHRAFSCWVKNEDGVAAVEAAFVFPIMLTLLLGTFDLGNGILANQKAIRASQVTADLISRNSEVSASMINEAIQAGELAFEPLPNASFGVDIISVSFDDEENVVIEWQETRNMSAMSAGAVAEAVASLIEAGEGVLLVVVEYEFEPVFGGFIVDTIPMREIAFARGRKSAVVQQI